MTGHSVVLVTAPNADKAAEIGRTVVAEGLAACANLVPGVRSIYRWEGKLQDAQEILLVIKTRRELFEALRDRVVQLHPYEVPEVIELELTRGHAPYLEWIVQNTQGR